MKHDLQDPALQELYKQMAAEDVALAGQGMAAYDENLKKAD